MSHHTDSQADPGGPAGSTRWCGASAGWRTRPSGSSAYPGGAAAAAEPQGAVTQGVLIMALRCIPIGLVAYSTARVLIMQDPQMAGPPARRAHCTGSPLALLLAKLHACFCACFGHACHTASPRGFVRSLCCIPRA
jgi:hypothetical protein